MNISAALLRMAGASTQCEVDEARDLIAYGTTDGAMMVVTIERGEEEAQTW